MLAIWELVQLPNGLFFYYKTLNMFITQLRSLNWKIIIIKILALVIYTQSAVAQVSYFAGVQIPYGVALDTDDNIFIYHDNLVNNQLTKFNPSGQVEWFVNTGVFTDVGQWARMALIPSLGTLVGLFPNGDLVEINPITGLITLIGNFKQTPIDQSSVYNVETGTYSGTSFFIQPEFATYGDIAVYEDGDDLYLFLTAIYAGGPFVIRALFVDGQFEEADVIIASSGFDQNTSELPRGIAVNENGTVLTTLPINPIGTVLSYDAGFHFDYDFGSSDPPEIVLGGVDVAI